ncbi:unnamed protein product [Diatraea saccharalis]|uniref:CCHC-type domain-containing protein n=1 Tax=Diatraea saccharalis TaxID=40085 RepID=A0A9N9R1V8_9NEOP|nr:unnamed protein product [Diatraea saccharalis]
MDSVAVVLEVAAKSGNLKGTSIKALKDAATLITKMLGGLYERNVNEDTKLLESRFQSTMTELKCAKTEISRISADNAKLREDVGGLRLVQDELKRARTPASRERRQTTVGEMTIEELQRLIIDQTGTMVSARIEGLARRLPPEESLRPPLEADKRRLQAVGSAKPVAGPSTDAPTTSKGRKLKKKEAKKAKANAQQATQPAPPATSAEEGWVTVTKRGARTKAAATGASLIEVAGDDIEELTEKLLVRMRELIDPEIAEVSRPMKTAAFRISGLDDAVEALDIHEAVSEQGGCQTDTVLVSEIRQSRRGMGTAVVRCPISAAKKLIEGGRKRLLVGWVSVAINILPSKPMRCFRCHELGHVVAKYDRVDRSALCLRCGGPNHKARECTAASHCMVCAAAGAASNHMLGGKSCKPPQRAKRREKTSGPASTTVPESEAMETAKI